MWNRIRRMSSLGILTLAGIWGCSESAMSPTGPESQSTAPIATTFISHGVQSFVGGPSFSAVPELFQVCKVGSDASFDQTGGNRVGASFTVTNGTCDTIYVKPLRGTSTIAVTETPIPNGFQLDSIVVLSVNDGVSPLTLTGTATVNRLITGVLGYTAVYYNSPLPPPPPPAKFQVCKVGSDASFDQTGGNQVGASFTVADGTCTIVNLGNSTITVTENPIPAGFQLDSIVVVAGTGGPSPVLITGTATVTRTVSGTVDYTATYYNSAIPPPPPPPPPGGNCKDDDDHGRGDHGDHGRDDHDDHGRDSHDDHDRGHDDRGYDDHGHDNHGRGGYGRP
jgi:hypothetical protein